MHIKIMAAFLLSASMTLSGPTAIYNPTRTWLVDSINSNYLFRGNEPLNEDGTLASKEMKATFQKITGKSLDGYSLIDISVIDCISEKTDLLYEFTAYGLKFDSIFTGNVWPPSANGYDVQKLYSNVSWGRIGWYPVQGCTDSTNCSSVEDPLFKWLGIADYLNQMLTKGNKLVIYYHCEHGHDRTSAVSAAYMMLHKKTSCCDALTLDPPRGAKGFDHLWEINYKTLVLWYAEKLGIPCTDSCSALGLPMNKN